MIDPIQSLAFSVQSNRGVYALLLGSGVSRSAGIPTGWEIVLDLLGRLAVATDQSPDVGLEEWYREKYGEAPDYSKLLDELAKTPAERQQLLRPYFEPNDQEREEGAKQPTAAHRAIAQLVAQGFVRVIITTNFDRLIEKALEDVGVVPIVLSSPEQMDGALPLIHTQCCVFKVHGDYMDTRIRNSVAELDDYPQEFNQIRDRIFDEFGLIVCGWSADWDRALCNAISRAPNRRFTTYLALRREASDAAQQLINHRDGQVIHIDDADTFFQTIQQTIESIQEYSKPHPLSIEAAVASLKRYLSNHEYRIQLFDLTSAAVERVVNATSGEDFSMGQPEPDKQTMAARIHAYESACATLLTMAPIVGFWANEDNSGGLERAIERLIPATVTSGKPVWVSLRAYPGFLLLYALGLGAVESDQASQLDFLNRVFRKTIPLETSRNQASNAVSQFFRSRHDEYWKFLEGMERMHMPFSEWVHRVLRQPLRQLIPDDDKYTLTFDRFEILTSLAFTSLPENDPNRFPLGAFIYRSSNRQRISAEMSESISVRGDESQLVKCGIFGETPEECLQRINHFEEYVSQMALRRGIF